MEKNKKKKNNKFFKKLLCILTVVICILTFFVTSVGAIQASIGVEGNYRASIPLTSIRVHNNKDIIGGNGYSIYDVTLSDYLSFSVVPGSPRYMIQVPALPQLDGYPLISSVQNLFTALSSTFERDGVKFVSASSKSSEFKPSTADKKFVNPFNSEKIVFNFADFVLLNDGDFPAIWCYQDMLQLDQTANYTLQFNIFLKDNEGDLVPYNFSLDSADIRAYFRDTDYNYLSNNQLTLSYENFYLYLIENGVNVNTDGLFIADCRFTVEYSLSNSNNNYMVNAGYYSNLAFSDSRVAGFLNSNPIIKTVFTGIGDLSFTDWLENAVGGFLDFEFIPNVTLGSMLLVTISFGIVFFIMRMWRG